MLKMIRDAYLIGPAIQKIKSHLSCLLCVQGLEECLPQKGLSGFLRDSHMAVMGEAGGVEHLG